MSKIVLYPANGFDFDAADVAAYLAGLTSGVFSSAEDFPVTAAGGLTVTVGAGRGWVHPSRFTGYSITKRESDTLTMPLADPSLPRIDRIIMRYDAGARAASLQVLQGTASSTPTAPAISRTELIYDLCLAEIKRPAGSTAVTAADIYDTRADETVCGVMRDGVHGIPTGTLVQQWKAVIESMRGGSFYTRAEVDALLKSLKSAVKALKNSLKTQTDLLQRLIPKSRKQKTKCRRQSSVRSVRLKRQGRRLSVLFHAQEHRPMQLPKSSKRREKPRI